MLQVDSLLISCPGVEVVRHCVGIDNIQLKTSIPQRFVGEDQLGDLVYAEGNRLGPRTPRRGLPVRVQVNDLGQQPVQTRVSIGRRVLGEYFAVETQNNKVV